MTKAKFQAAQKYMLLHKDSFTTATEMAEDCAVALGLEDELGDETSIIWDLAHQAFTEKRFEHVV